MVFDMVQQIGQTLFQSIQILRVQLGLGHTAVVLQRAHGGHDDHGVRAQPRQTALDVQKLLRAQVRAEAGLGDDIVAQLERHTRGGDGVAAVGDVGKRAAVDEAWAYPPASAPGWA